MNRSYQRHSTSTSTSKVIFKFIVMSLIWQGSWKICKTCEGKGKGEVKQDSSTQTETLQALPRMHAYAPIDLEEKQ